MFGHAFASSVDCADAALVTIDSLTFLLRQAAEVGWYIGPIVE
jgi:hypothetical protein